MAMSVKEMWAAPELKGQISFRGLVGAASWTAVVAAIVMAIVTVLQTNSTLFGTWGPIIAAIATLIIQIFTKLNLGIPVPPVSEINRLNMMAEQSIKKLRGYDESASVKKGFDEPKPVPPTHQNFDNPKPHDPKQHGRYDRYDDNK